MSRWATTRRGIDDTNTGSHTSPTGPGICSGSQGHRDTKEQDVSSYEVAHLEEIEELYLVLSGEARFEVDGDSIQARPGTFVRVPPGVMRTAFAEQPGTTIVAMGGGRDGEPYRPGGWEVWSPLRPLMEAGRHEELLARARPLLEQELQYPEVLYNVACSESLLGRSDNALT